MTLYPTDNELEIAALPMSADAREATDPVIGWGTCPRASCGIGTYHYYVDDYRFSKLLMDPSRILNSGCLAACEPNISIYEQTPRWEAIQAIGRKRAVAYAWAQAGVKLFVDLCVPARHHDIALLGVPEGWRSYSTRAYADRLHELTAEWALAHNHSDGEPLLLVVGGGEAAREMCRTLPGAVHVRNSLGTTEMPVRAKERDQLQGRRG